MTHKMLLAKRYLAGTVIPSATLFAPQIVINRLLCIALPLLLVVDRFVAASSSSAASRPPSSSSSSSICSYSHLDFRGISGGFISPRRTTIMLKIANLGCSMNSEKEFRQRRGAAAPQFNSTAGQSDVSCKSSIENALGKVSLHR